MFAQDHANQAESAQIWEWTYKCETVSEGLVFVRVKMLMSSAQIVKIL